MYCLTKAACISTPPRLGTGQCHPFVKYVVLKSFDNIIAALRTSLAQTGWAGAHVWVAATFMGGHMVSFFLFFFPHLFFGVQC